MSHVNCTGGTCEPTATDPATAPTEPTDPTEPTEPTDPTETTDPTEPTAPTEPTDPTEPTEPTDPTDLVELAKLRALADEARISRTDLLTGKILHTLRHARTRRAELTQQLHHALVMWHIRKNTLSACMNFREMWSMAVWVSGWRNNSQSISEHPNPKVDVATAVVGYLLDLYMTHASYFHQFFATGVFFKEPCFEELLKLGLICEHHELTAALMKFATVPALAEFVQPVVVKTLVNVVFGSVIFGDARTPEDIKMFEAVPPEVLGCDILALLQLSEAFAALTDHLHTWRAAVNVEEFKTRTAQLVQSAVQAMQHPGLSAQALGHVVIDFEFWFKGLIDIKSIDDRLKLIVESRTPKARSNEGVDPDVDAPARPHKMLRVA